MTMELNSSPQFAHLGSHSDERLGFFEMSSNPGWEASTVDITEDNLSYMRTEAPLSLRSFGRTDGSTPRCAAPGRVKLSL